MTPNGTMVPKFTVVVRPRSDKPQLVRRFHFTEGLFEIRNLDRKQYKVEITSPSFTGVLMDLKFGDTKNPATYRIVVLEPARSEVELLAGSYTLMLKRTGQEIPPRAEAAYRRGVELHRQGKLDEAMMAYGETIRIFPECAQALSDIGNIYIVLNRPESALTFLRRALKADPQNLAARLNMAAALVNQRKYGDGIRIFQEVLKEHEGAGIIRYFLAKAYWDQGKPELAENTIRQALKETPGMIAGWVLLLNLAVEQGNQASARETLLRLKEMMDDIGFSKFVDRQMTTAFATN